jgi:hypothetical protein
MPIRYFAILVAFCFAIQHVSGQKLPLFHTLDSLKKAEKNALNALLRTNATQQSIAAVTDKYDDKIDDMRDAARDAADSVMDHMDKCSHFELGLDIASRQLIYGRKGPAYGADGTPTLKYMHWTSIYGQFNTDDYKLVYQQAKLGKRSVIIDTVTTDKIENDIVLTLGFARTFYEWWDMDAYFDHTFIFYGANRNYLATTFNLNNSVNFFDYITLDVYYSIYFGGPAPAKEKKYSNVLTFGLSHDFKIYRFLGAKVFTITPQFLTDAGNDNYVRNRLLARDENGGLTLTKPATDNFFGLLNLEAGVNFDYRIKNLQIYIDPRLAIPFNVVPNTAASTAPYRNNDPDKPIFYVTAGIKYIFKFWKEKHHNYDDGNKSKSRS